MTPSDDLFAEAFSERAGIMEHDAGLPRETAEAMARADVTANLHACEVRDVVARYRKAVAAHGEDKAKRAIDKFFADVAGHRGQPAAYRLRTDALAALKNK